MSDLIKSYIYKIAVYSIIPLQSALLPISLAPKPISDTTMHVVSKKHYFKIL